MCPDLKMYDNGGNRFLIEEMEFEVQISGELLSKIMVHASSSSEDVAGLLIGNFDQPGFLVIHDCVKGKASKSKNDTVVLDESFLMEAASKYTKEEFGENIVGWYHSHNEKGIFTSDEDISIQNKFQSLFPNAILLVVDPGTNEFNFFKLIGNTWTTVEHNIGMEPTIEIPVTLSSPEIFEDEGLTPSATPSAVPTTISPPSMPSVPILEETYPLIPPFAYALIQTDPISKRTKYIVVEVPVSSEDREIMKMVKEFLVESLDIDFGIIKKKGKAMEYLRKKISEIIKDYDIKIDEKGFDKLTYFVSRDFIGFGKIEPMMKDHMIEDISCDGTNVQIYIWHRKYESIPTSVIFETEEELDSLVIKMAQRAGRHISVAQPLLDASLDDGSRIQITYGKEVTQRGSTFTIRKFRADPLTITDLIMFNTLEPEMAAFFWFVLEHRHSVLIAGGVASGKTTLMNCLSMFILPDLKIVSIEDTAELNIAHDNWIPSVARPGLGSEKRGEITMFDLLKASLRQRPDYIIVGEIRGEEAYSLFQAMATGHLGMSTIHGDSVPSVIHRLESEPMNIPRGLLSSLDIVAIMRKIRYGGKYVRRCIVVQEMIGIDPVTNEILTNKTFSWNPRDDSFIYLGRSIILEKIMEQMGLAEDDIWSEIDRRKTILRYMVKKRIRNYQDVASLIREYYSDPEGMYERASRGLI